MTYAYDNRYLFEANAAYNGSEKFDRKYRFGFFPSIAVGWVVSNEQFFLPLKSVMNNLKFRYSDGKVGSDEGIARWLYTSNYIVHPYGGANETVVWFGTPVSQRGYPLRYRGTIPNKEIHWETARKRDFGVETGFFNNQLKINFDYFCENRSEIFLSGADRVMPSYFGADPVSANIGKVDVKGWEFEGSFTKTTKGGFTFWISHAWVFAIDKIIEKGDPELKPDYQKQAGYQIGQPRVTLNQGVHSVMNNWSDVYLTTGGETNSQLLPGDFMRIDFNADGKIDANDQVPYGFPARPQYSYAPSAGISYKNFSANLRFYGVYNVEGGVVDGYTFSAAGGDATVIDHFLKTTWSPERNITSEAIQPQLRFNTSQAGGYYDRSRSYLRLESAEIAYTLNSNNSAFIRKLELSSMRFKLSGNNLLLFSKMLTDKDYGGESRTDTRFNYPVLKRYSLGFSIDF